MEDTARARGIAIVFAIACIVSAAFGFAHVAVAAIPSAALAAVLGIVAIVFAGQPIQRATAFDVDFMVSRVWLVGGFGLLIPLIAPVLIVLGIWHLTHDTIGGYHTTKEGGGGRFYPKILLREGEQKPLGLLFLALGILWPAVVAGIVFATR